MTSIRVKEDVRNKNRRWNMKEEMLSEVDELRIMLEWMNAF